MSGAWRHLRIGLTGGIATGKSTVARMFAELGVPVIDTDELARNLVAPGQPALDDIVAAFGSGILTELGELDRRALRTLVFDDPSRRRRLEAILHPKILAAAEATAEGESGPYQILVVPLLFESGFEQRVDRVLAVDCPETVQRARLQQRDDESPERIERILRAQLGRDARLGRADDVIDNAGDLDHTRAQVGALHRRYLALARARR